MYDFTKNVKSGLLCAVMGYTYTAHAEEYYDMRVEVTTQRCRRIYRTSKS